MTRFTLATLQTSDGRKAAMGVDDKFYLVGSLAPSLADATCKSILQNWDAMMPVLQALADEIASCFAAQQRGIDKGSVSFSTPVLYPDSLLAIGANYPKGEAPKPRGSTSLAFFLRPPRTTLVGPGDTVAKPRMTKKFDWECELVVFVGRRLRNASVEEAAAAVAGYAVGLDLACRDLIEVENELKVDLVRGKSQDTMAPCGPVIMPAKFIPDVNNMRIQMYVNEEKMIDASTCEMISKVEEQLSTLSEFMTIEAGDMLFTGSPRGSAAQHGDRWLQSGDRIRAEIQHVGILNVTIHNA